MEKQYFMSTFSVKDKSSVEYPWFWLLMKWLYLLLLLVMTPLSGVVPAHAEDPNFDRTYIVGDHISYNTVTAIGDLNNDGALDIVVGNQGQDPDLIYFNDGYGRFPQAVSFSNDNETFGLALGDVNGDGSLDIVMANKYEKNLVYLNDGSSNFAQFVAFGEEADDTFAVRMGDMNGDGSYDIIELNGSAPSRIYLNDGVGNFNRFVEFTKAQDVIWDAEVGDINGDGTLDIIAGKYEQPDTVYLNIAGEFSKELVFETTVEDSRNVVLADINGDNTVDIVTSNMIYINDGSGYFGTTLPFEPVNDYNITTVGDMNSDGIIDLVGGSYVYLNSGTGKSFTPIQIRGEGHGTKVGDMDSDGDLDVVVVDNLSAIKIYYNDGVGNFSSLTSVGHNQDVADRLIVGDMNNDSNLDLIAGSKIYLSLQDGNLSEFTPCISSPDLPSALMIGDIDDDNALDIITYDSIYLNKGCYFTQHVTFPTKILTIGDVNGDGPIDIITHSAIYRNDGSGNFISIPSDISSYSVGIVPVLGDLNGDNSLDLIVGEYDDEIKIYINDGNGNFKNSTSLRSTQVYPVDVAVGDMDSDGNLDIVVANYIGPGTIFFNDGHGNFSIPLFWGTSSSENIAIGDINGDGFLDISAYYSSQKHEVYLNDGKGDFTEAVPFGEASDDVGHVVLADMNNDGMLEIITSYYGAANVIYFNHYGISKQKLTSTPYIFVESFTLTPSTNFYSSPQILSDQVIPINYRLTDQKNSYTHIRTYFSSNGGVWKPAIAKQGTVTSGILSNSTQTFYWDTFASGLFGQFDSIRFRIEAYPQPVHTGVAGTYHYTNSIPGPYLFPYTAATTSPFRVRGTQVRVVDQTGQPLPNAIVYRLPKDHPVGGQLMGNAESPFRTSSQGYLSGRGELGIGDQLVVLWPSETHEKYTLYHTSAKPVADINLAPNGLEAYRVQQPGVQTLTVSPDNPLLLFDLDVSLEWNAGNDPGFLSQLEQNLLKASAALYDWTNGQVALGKVTVYQAKAQWDEADIRIYASNQVRPVANRGGIVRDETIIPLPAPHEPITATRGEIRIGAVWNRYGDANPTGDDWPNVLAHELGHYLLFLEDTYLGLDKASGLLVPITTCSGTAMTDPYDAANSELRYSDDTWERDCGSTLAELPDWDLLQLAYPAMKKPIALNSGPPFMPFAFTRIDIRTAPMTSKPLLIDSNIALNGSESALANGRAYLRMPGQRIVDLGRPVLGAVAARGAHEGDELCIFADAKFACTELRNGAPPQLQATDGWKPEIALTPINTTTFELVVSSPTVNALTATIYPTGEHPQVVTITPNVTQTIVLNQPAVEVWVDLAGDQAGQRIITEYVVGSGPGRLRSHDGPGRLRSHDGPFTTGDGRVTLYPPVNLDKETFIALQTATTLPALPAGLATIGRSYYVRPSQTIADFSGGSIAFQYLGLDVLLTGVPEENLVIYYWNGSLWRSLPTELNTIQNFASAPLLGPGLYALVSGFYASLVGPDWNDIAYPASLASQPVTQALASVADAYSIVYGCEPSYSSDPWSVYAPGTPGWVNDLRQMEPQKIYKIYVTESVTWTVGSPAISAATMNPCSNYPPATFYGELVGEFAPGTDITVVAMVNDNMCGQSKVQKINNQFVFDIHVAADNVASTSRCGRLDMPVRFEVNGQPLSMQGNWDNRRVQSVGALVVAGEQGLGTSGGPQPNYLYLPLISNE